jgi:hypothetical protein
VSEIKLVFSIPPPKPRSGWRSYAVVMLFFSVAGFVTLYALQRVVFVQPVHDQHDRALKLVVSAYQPASEQRATARPAARSSSPPAVRTR